jgi:DNA/RNA-binding domain of Phe-tRNA-synthetase-like protein
MSLTIAVEPHPLLEVGVFVTRLQRPVAQTATPDDVVELATPGVIAPLASSDQVKTAVRDLLRQGGFKPAGRSKPASEYLAANAFPRINVLVDTCNVVSLHSGLPISVVDADRLVPPLAIRVAPPASSYVFNPSGQIIDAGGLVCLYDAAGPSGSPVKDAQRTKTHDGTHAVVCIVWGTKALGDRTTVTTRWYRELSARIAGATVEDVTLV